MKKQFNYYLSPGSRGLGALFSACTPEDHDMPAASVTSAELVEGIAFSVDLTRMIPIQSILNLS